jgi:hypothetical protein
MTEPNTSNEAKTFLDARDALDAREAALVAELATIHAAQGKRPRGRKAKDAKRASRPALGTGLKKDGTQRKTRGPNKPKPLGTYVPKTPLATGIEKSEQA